MSCSVRSAGSWSRCSAAGSRSTVRSRICELEAGHAGLHTGEGPNRGAVSRRLGGGIRLIARSWPARWAFQGARPGERADVLVGLEPFRCEGLRHAADGGSLLLSRSYGPSLQAWPSGSPRLRVGGALRPSPPPGAVRGRDVTAASEKSSAAGSSSWRGCPRSVPRPAARSYQGQRRPVVLRVGGSGRDDRALEVPDLAAVADGGVGDRLERGGGVVVSEIRTATIRRSRPVRPGSSRASAPAA